MATSPDATPTVTFRLTGPRPSLDPRRYIARDDLVEIGLADRVAAVRYVAPWRAAAVAALTPLRARPDATASAVSAILFGETLAVFERVGDWALVRGDHDDYVGWLPAAVLVAADSTMADRAVTARSAPLFAGADIKSPVLAMLPFGARLTGAVHGAFWSLERGGFVHGRHVAALVRPTPVDVARRFLGAPYVWGGRTPDGVDCSGLVQAALAACGIRAPRDSDQQRDAIGRPVTFNDRAAGDVLFFPGHVGLLSGRDTLLHANAHWMTTLEEPLADVIGRLHAAGVATPVLAVRRP